MSYQLIWGAFREYLEDIRKIEARGGDLPDEIRLMQLSGQICRAGMYGIKDRLSVARLGMHDRISVASILIAGGPGMAARLVAGLTGIDIVRQFYLYYLAVEPSPGAAHAIYQRTSQEIVTLIAKPSRVGYASTAQKGRHWIKLRRLT